MRCGAICKAATHTHRASITRSLCASSVLFSYQRPLQVRLFIPSTIGLGRHHCVLRLMSSAKHGLYLSLNPPSLLQLISLQGLFYLTSLLLSHIPCLITWLPHSSRCVSVDLNKTSQNFSESTKLSSHSNSRTAGMPDVVFPLMKNTGSRPI
jgi:hypothetical protein